ncbi:hypothetical protein U9M48_035410 [Paspalum notatum var. saurae]|uniref:Uncharacterized protein n=1 Tax=Paspalum notatum var. saurae TaxID=547442 RepID=A0AAQ3UD30_PASNO
MASYDLPCEVKHSCALWEKEYGSLPMLLWNILREHGHQKMPEYVGHKFKMDDRAEWSVDVRIFHAMMDNGEFQVAQIHQSPVRRSTFVAAVRDATLQAIYRVAKDYEMELMGSQYHYFPSRGLDSYEAEVNPTKYEANPKLVQQVRLTLAMDDMVHSFQQELKETRARLRQAESTIASLKEDLAGEASAVGTSLPRKRSRAGPVGSDGASEVPEA